MAINKPKTESGGLGRIVSLAGGIATGNPAMIAGGVAKPGSAAGNIAGAAMGVQGIQAAIEKGKQALAGAPAEVQKAYAPAFEKASVLGSANPMMRRFGRLNLGVGGE